MRIKPMVMGVLALGYACVFGEGTKEVGVKGGAPGAAARKLQTCGFLLNKDFKKDVKYYLCLFSASWCGPCRREMPRIAKTYAETLKDDPDIELIHFSWDQNDEKALAWAKEHDVKFPVVKPKGGNPLDLHSRGIPHLFIVDADGKLIEEGHPAKLFTDEKLRELKTANGGGRINGKSTSDVSKSDEVKLPYEVVDGAVVLGSHGRSGLLMRRLLSRRQKGATQYAAVKFSSGSLVIPEVVDGLPVKGIGYGAFSNCKGLTSVTIPSNVTSIVNGAFSGCDEITSFSVDASNPSYSSRDGVLCSKDGTALIAGVNGEVTIPSCVKSIGKEAFKDHNGLMSVTIPESVTNIADMAFSSCNGLKSVRIPANVESIGKAAFSYCSALKEINVDAENKTFTSIDGVLYTKDRSELVACPNALTAVTIPKGVTGIGPYAFEGCNNMTSVTIPEGVTRIECAAFKECGGLASVAIPSSVERIEKEAFLNCRSLTSVTILSKMLDIGYGAFKECGELTAVTMRGECPTSQNDIFKGCGKLKAIHVPATAKSWDGMQTWHGIPLVVDGAAGPKTAAIEIEDLDIAVVKERAENGDAAAMCELGSRYRRGVGVSVDDKEAEKWIMKAASNGHERATGLCYAYGYGVAKDSKEAVKWYMKAVGRGDRVAMNNLGICYERGDGVEKNEKEAAKWMRTAAEKGFCLAMCNLSHYYYNGIGVDKDDKESLKWLRMAAEKGDAEAMFDLGCCYANGDGVEKDDTEAEKWYRRAADKGVKRESPRRPVRYVRRLPMGQTLGARRLARMQREAEQQRVVDEQRAREAEEKRKREVERAKLEAERAKFEAERAKRDAEREAERAKFRAEKRRELEAIREELRKAREERQKAEQSAAANGKE